MWLFLLVLVRVYVCVCVHVNMCVGMWEFVCRGQRQTSDIIP